MFTHNNYYADYCKRVCQGRIGYVQLPLVPQGELIKEVDLIVFDFDCTITNVHSCKKPIPDILIFTDDVEPFKRLVQSLFANGKLVAIASYGYKHVILNTMEKIFGGDNQFSDYNVITPIDIGWKECRPPAPESGLSKNNMLSKLKERLGIPSNDRIVLFDDDEFNINNARFEGYRAYKVARCAGMGQTAPDIASRLGI